MKKKMMFIADARSIHTLRWYNYFKKKGWNLKLVSIYPGRVKGKDVTALLKKQAKAKALSYMLLGRKVKEVADKFKPDLVFALYLYPYGYLAGKCDGYNRAVSVIGSDILVTAQKYPKKIVSSLLNKFDYIHCHGKYIEDAVKRFNPPRKLSKEVWGVDLKQFKRKKAPGLKKKLGIEKGDIVLIDQRAFEDVYAIDVLINATEEIVKKHKNVKLVLAGVGVKEKELKEYARKKGLLGTHVIFPKGGVSTKDVPAYLSISDIYIQAPRSDAIAIALMEAMATPMACVSTNIGGTKYYLKHGKCGYLVPKDDYKKLAFYTLKLVKDKKLRNRMTRECFKVAKKEFDEKKNMHVINKRLLSVA